MMGRVWRSQAIHIMMSEKQRRELVTSASLVWPFSLSLCLSSFPWDDVTRIQDEPSSLATRSVNTHTDTSRELTMNLTITITYIFLNLWTVLYIYLKLNTYLLPGKLKEPKPNSLAPSGSHCLVKEAARIKGSWVDRFMLHIVIGFTRQSVQSMGQAFNSHTRPGLWIGGYFPEIVEIQLWDEGYSGVS